MEKFFDLASFALEGYIVLNVLAIIVAVPLFIWLAKRRDKEQKEFQERMERNRIDFFSKFDKAKHHAEEK